MEDRKMIARPSMKTAVVNAIVALGMVLAGVPSANAMPAGDLPVIAAGSGEVIPVATASKRQKKKKHKASTPKKAAVWHKTRYGQGRLEGRVEDIDRREGRRKPAKNRARGNEEFNRFLLEVARGAFDTGNFGGGRPSGCGIDVGTPNPTGCGTRYTDSGGSNGLRPPYQCPVNGRIVTTNTFRAGCWMVRQNNVRIPMP